MSIFDIREKELCEQEKEEAEIIASNEYQKELDEKLQHIEQIENGVEVHIKVSHGDMIEMDKNRKLVTFENNIRAICEDAFIKRYGTDTPKQLTLRLTNDAFHYHYIAKCEKVVQ